MATSDLIRCRLNLQRPVATTGAESSRYALGNALVTPAKPGTVYLTGTDGHCMSIATADGDCLDGKEHFVPTPIVDKMPKRGRSVELNGQWLVDQKTIVPAAAAGRFPRTEDVLPNLKARPPVFAIHLDADLIAKVQRSINGEKARGLTLIFTSADDPVVALGANGVGVIMPMSFGELDEKTDKAMARHVADYETKREAYAKARAGFRESMIDDSAAH